MHAFPAMARRTTVRRTGKTGLAEASPDEIARNAPSVLILEASAVIAGVLGLALAVNLLLPRIGG